MWGEGPGKPWGELGRLLIPRLSAELSSREADRPHSHLALRYINLIAICVASSEVLVLSFLRLERHENGGLSKDSKTEYFVRSPRAKTAATSRDA